MSSNWTIFEDWAKPHSSLVHSLPTYLESQNQVDSKSRIIGLSLSYYPHYHVHDNSRGWNPYWPRCKIHRLNLGDILAIHRSESGIDYDRSYRIPYLLRV